MLFIKTFILFCLIFMMSAIPALAQQRPIQQTLPPLTGVQKNTLLLIAREAIDATLENRDSRQATVEPRLTMAQPMVISVYVDGKLRGRAWRLKTETPLFENARNVTYEAIDNPKVGGDMLSLEELAKAEVSVAVLSNYTQVQDDREVPPRSAVVIYNGFTEWMALPSDIESDKASDLLTYACTQAGLRPNIWLLPQTTIIAANVEEVRENRVTMPEVNLNNLRGDQGLPLSPRFTNYISPPLI